MTNLERMVNCQIKKANNTESYVCCEGWSSLQAVGKNLQRHDMTEGIPVISMVTGIFLPSFFEKTLIFTLIGFLTGNAATQGIHAVGAFLLHHLRRMSVDVQCKCRSCVPQVFLNRLDVISGV